ncbi:MAG: ThiF family adenylyltransferase [Thaumarchaeota archaeon]|nr:ThiF family adenylyltransferase [Nitrososphaerota archaeon]
MNESVDDRTVTMIDQLTKSKNELSKWYKIPGRVAIISNSLKRTNERLALAMSVNCLSRLYPIITNLDIVISSDIQHRIEAPLFDGQDVKRCITSFLEKLSPKVEVRILNNLEDYYDALLSIGNTKEEHSFTISISSDGWLSFVSPNSLSNDFTDNMNPVGAYVAANLGCIEVFKKVFVKKADLIIPKRSNYDFRWNTKHLQKELTFNTFDYSVDNNSKNPSLPDTINTGELVTSGVGAGGGACLYTLASFPDLRGNLSLIDPDEVKGSNLNRYIYATRHDADDEKPKVDVMKKILSIHKQCNVISHYMSYKKFSDKLNDKPIDLIISTVDTGEARLEIQWDLPKMILDAAVFNTWFYINRVEFGDNACLGCRFYREESSDSSESYLSKIIGLSEEVILSLRTNNATFEEKHIEIMKPFSEKNKFSLPKTGEHFQDWFRYHCGELKLNGQIDPIPVPFATVMPGILLAGEVVKQRHFKNYKTRDFFSLDVFGIPINTFEQVKRKKDCPICSNQSTVNRYKEKNSFEC